MASGNSPQVKIMGPGSRLVGTLFFSVFLLMGLGFEVMIVRQTLANLATYSWTKADAVVASSEVIAAQDAQHDPVLHVVYTYTFDGQTCESDRIEIGNGDLETSDAYRLAQHYMAGATVPCWVNPSLVSDVVLQRASPASGFLVLFPLIFVAVGGIGIWSVWRKKSADASTKPISSRGSTAKTGRMAVVLISSIFLLIGLGISYPILFQPLTRLAAARSWREIPAEVISSRVKTHRGNKGSTYSVEVVYRYTYQGHTYTSNRFHFARGSSSGYQGKAEVVQELPAGKQVLCFVDPVNPEESVLERGFTADLWFGLFPLVFAAAGAAGLYFSLRMKTAAAPSPSFKPLTSTYRSTLGSDRPSYTVEGGPQPLAPAISPNGKLIGLIIFALIWNSVVSVFVFNLFKGGAGGFSWFLALFLVPFVAIGLGTIGGVFYYAMALFNPRPRLTTNPGVLLAGETVSVQWELAGRTDRLRRLQIALEGREEATFRRGTDTRTDKEVFTRIQVTDTTDPLAMRGGSARISLPAGAMHSFNAPNNKIVWLLKVNGDIPRWPDIKDEYPVTVAPTPLTR